MNDERSGRDLDLARGWLTAEKGVPSDLADALSASLGTLLSEVRREAEGRVRAEEREANAVAEDARFKALEERERCAELCEKIAGTYSDGSVPWGTARWCAHEIRREGKQSIVDRERLRRNADFRRVLDHGIRSLPDDARKALEEIVAPLKRSGAEHEGIGARGELLGGGVLVRNDSHRCCPPGFAPENRLGIGDKWACGQCNKWWIVDAHTDPRDPSTPLCWVRVP